MLLHGSLELVCYKSKKAKILLSLILSIKKATTKSNIYMLQIFLFLFRNHTQIKLLYFKQYNEYKIKVSPIF